MSMSRSASLGGGRLRSICMCSLCIRMVPPEEGVERVGIKMGFGGGGGGKGGGTWATGRITGRMTHLSDVRFVTNSNNLFSVGNVPKVEAG